MTSLWGARPILPRDVRDGAVRRARELGRRVVSDDLFLLALSDGDELQPARRAVVAAGATSDRLVPHIRVAGDHPAGPTELHFSPAFYTMQGLAQGFAATLGDGAITPEHVLLALLWTADGHSCQVLWKLGISRESIVDRLRQLDVAVPRAALPRQIEVQIGERVWFERDQAPDVIAHLRLQIPPGTRWGFNYAADRAWAFAESSVDMDALVRAALASS